MKTPTFPMTDEEVKIYFAEQEEERKKRPIKSIHPLATFGSMTERGGEVVTASTGIRKNNLAIACVGDLVRYPNGSESKIESGAGSALTYQGKPVAVIGSHVENGDTIISSLQMDTKIIQYADEKDIPGLLQRGYLPEPSEVGV